MRNLLENKLTLGLILVLILVVVGGYFGYQKFLASKAPSEEVEITFDAEGPYAVITPRRDGNALILNLKRTASYDEISYELSYLATPDATSVSTDEGNAPDGKIERGVVGNIDTKDKKGEYSQDILFGSCSKNVCKYDQGVENGTLVLHIRRGSEAFKMTTFWHFQRPDIALGKLSSSDEHFKYTINDTRENLTSIGYTIISQVTGVPKLPQGKQVFGNAYNLSTSSDKILAGEISLESADKIPDGVKIYRVSDQGNWEELATAISGSKATAKANSAGIFAILVPMQ